MISAVARTSALSPCMFAVAQVVPSSVRPFVPAVTQKAQKVFCEPSPLILRNTTLSKQLLSRNGTLAVTGLTTGSQIRLAHTDIQVPDFGMYRRESTKNATVKSDESNVTRKGFTYLLVGGGTVVAAYGGKNVAQEFIQTMTASADVLALAKIEVNLSDIAEGKSATFKWRNKPLFVRHRTAEEIAKEEAVDPSILRHKESDSDRVQRPEWLVILGICTHLGCVPIVGVGDYGGYYCPCHGSHYDGSGRIRKGPAPLNMEVPEYVFIDDTTLVVG